MFRTTLDCGISLKSRIVYSRPQYFEHDYVFETIGYILFRFANKLFLFKPHQVSVIISLVAPSPLEAILLAEFD